MPDPRATAVLLAALAGCSSTPAPVADLSIESGNYPAAFQAAKDALRDYEFELDRVDAREGVITTAPRAWSGAATPWLPYTSTPRDAIEGLGQFEQRTARVEFHPTDTNAAPVSDLRDFSGTLTASVVVTVERLYRPGRRVDATSVRLAGFASEGSAQGPPAPFAVEHRKDHALAARIGVEINDARSREAHDSIGDVPR